jgi:integrase
MIHAITVPASYLPNSDIRHYLENALSNNTRRAYRTDLEHYIAWGAVIPSSPEMVAEYLTAHASTLSIATLQRRLVSIAKAHTMRGLADPTKNELVKLTLRGIRRIHGKPQSQVAALLRDDLILMLSCVPDTVKGKRDRALLLLGFCGALRRSELAAVRVEDLEFTAQGIILTLPRSKTDQTGQGRKIGIPKGRGRICPVQSITDWLVHLSALNGQKMHLSALDEQELHLSANNRAAFRAIDKGGVISATALSSRAIADIIKHYAAKAGLDADRYSGHSLRSGLATSAAQHGISSWVIRKQTGHKSETMLARYIRDGDLFTNNAAALF